MNFEELAGATGLSVGTLDLPGLPRGTVSGLRLPANGTAGQIRCSFHGSKEENPALVPRREASTTVSDDEAVPELFTLATASGAPGAPIHVQLENR
ncbi:hypothetical protein [Streptomyces sp. A012304]|uniref:hypothetical protein n=1 Tax=Streptomyces sp. A012304 TaxID=375446 RepID=UPI002231787E|nr:hypothetical protein [Streptomyces sp. A012304]GKQ40612.1 hypothetical protein ALMP_71350 [Streptomyces sp. A012304]